MNIEKKPGQDSNLCKIQTLYITDNVQCKNLEFWEDLDY